MEKLPLVIENIIMDYKNDFEWTDNDCCDKCDKSNDECKLTSKNCWKLDKPYYAEGDVYYYAWVACYCEDCIKTIKNFDIHKPRNT